MHGGASTRPLGMWNAPLWKLHSTTSRLRSPSKSDPGPCVQLTSVTKYRPARWNRARIRPSFPTLSASPLGISEVSQRSSSVDVSVIAIARSALTAFYLDASLCTTKRNAVPHRGTQLKRNRIPPKDPMKAEQNELLCRTGPGAPMGELFRPYWLPILLSWELPDPDCPPVRVRCLSERMVAFRDSKGRLGLIDEFCAHRGVSLWFGRNEECAIRCPYHGWKYDVTGQCVEVPSEPAESGFCHKIKLKAYPLAERGGVIRVYMGPAGHPPPLPEWGVAHVP